jgi:hypothetical protein
MKVTMAQVKGGLKRSSDVDISSAKFVKLSKNIILAQLLLRPQCTLDLKRLVQKVCPTLQALKPMGVTQALKP